MDWALDLALLKAGNSIAARMAMMAMTTSSSIKVKAQVDLRAADFFMLMTSSNGFPHTARQL
jgi:hypothetical protein